MRCHTCRSWMGEALYDELDEKRRSELGAHLERCASCRMEYGRLKGALGRLDEVSLPEPSREYWTGFGHKLQRRIAADTAREAPAAAIWDALRRPVVASAAAVSLVAMGLLAGYGLFHQELEQPVAAAQFQLTDRQLAARTARYIEQSEVIVLSLRNMETVDASHLSRLTEESSGLAFEAGLLEEELLEAGNEPLRQLVADLSVILMQIANTEHGGESLLRAVRAGIDQGSLLLRIDLTALQGLDGTLSGDATGGRGTSDIQI
ncbi:anti-sigma factor family protein [Candidatus Latescibacterota bacterium]